MISKYFKPTSKKVLDAYRTLITDYNGVDFYSNGYYAIKHDLLKEKYPSLWIKTLKPTNEIKPDLTKVIGDIGEYSGVVTPDHFVDLNNMIVEMITEPLGIPRIKVNVFYLSLFEGVKATGVKYLVKGTDKPILVMLGDEVIGCIMPLRN